MTSIEETRSTVTSSVTLTRPPHFSLIHSHPITLWKSALLIARIPPRRIKGHVKKQYVTTLIALRSAQSI